MEEKEQDKFEKYVAITAAVISVLLAISSILGNKAGGDSTMYLIKSNDQWSFYQAKSIKGHIYDVDRELLQTESSNPSLSKEYKEFLQKKADDFEQKTAKYDKEKQEIQGEAKKDEELSQKNNDKSDVYNYGQGFYQISLILAAVALLAKKKYMWVISCILGAIGFGFSVYAFLLP